MSLLAEAPTIRDERVVRLAVIFVVPPALAVRLEFCVIVELAEVVTDAEAVSVVGCERVGLSVVKGALTKYVRKLIPLLSVCVDSAV
jgi:hypothetical protein